MATKYCFASGNIDCDDRKAILMLNVVNPTQENIEEVIVHELMHIKMYPLDQVTESLITNCFEEDSAASSFAYQQFFTALEQTVEELTKCFLLEFGENKEFSYATVWKGEVREENAQWIREKRSALCRYTILSSLLFCLH